MTYAMVGGFKDARLSLKVRKMTGSLKGDYDCRGSRMANYSLGMVNLS